MTAFISLPVLQPNVRRLRVMIQRTQLNLGYDGIPVILRFIYSATAGGRKTKTNEVQEVRTKTATSGKPRGVTAAPHAREGVSHAHVCALQNLARMRFIVSLHRKDHEEIPKITV